jgi:hypothetical protein
MTYTIPGRLCGYSCPDVEEPVANAEIRVYRPGVDGEALAELVDASPTETARVLDAAAVEEKEHRELLRTQTDDEGRFELVFDDDSPPEGTTVVDEKGVFNYEGTPVELDVRLTAVPGETEPDPDPVQVGITVYNPAPRGRETEADATGFDYCFSARFWCSVRERFGAWVVCGRAWDCEAEESRAGLAVRVYDTDLVQADALGSATTDADGRFRVYFARAAFERTPLPFLSVELFRGPDLYFEVDDTRGRALLREDERRGREPDREDAGGCTHVELCVDLPPEADEGEGETVDPVPQFTHVGTYDISTDIDADGYGVAGSDRLAFTGVLPLTGVMPHGGAAAATEYRFEVEDLSTGVVTPLDGAAIRPTRIGTLQYWAESSPGTWTLRHEPYYLNDGGEPNSVPVGTDGWVEVPRADDLGAVGTPGTGSFVRDTGLLARFDSRVVLQEAFDLTTPTVHAAGDAVAPAERSTDHAFAVRFQSRDVGDPSTTRTDTLARIVVSNTTYTQRRHPTWTPDEVSLPGVVMLDIAEFVQTNDGCRALADTVTAAVTAYHPHVDGVSARIDGPGTDTSHSTGFTPTDGEVATTHAFDISTLQPCAYILSLRVSYLLTNGTSRVAPDRDRIAFCVGGA